MNNPDIFEEMLTNTGTKTLNYSVEYPSVIIDTKELASIISLVSTVIDLNARKAISRGIVLDIMDSQKLNIIYTNEIYYFKAEVETSTQLEEHKIFLDFQFIQRIAKFLPTKTLIYLKDDIYYIRLVTGDLELINPEVLEVDLPKLKVPYLIKEELKEVDLKKHEGAFNIYTKLLNLAVSPKKRVLNCFEDLIIFSEESTLKAIAPASFADMELRSKDVNYMYKVSKLLNETEKLKIFNVESIYIQRYCFKHNNMMLLSNYAKSKQDPVVLEKYKRVKELTMIDVSSILYTLSYISAITYSNGIISLIIKDDKLVCRVHLTNGNYSTTTFKILSELKIKTNKAIILNNKILYDVLSSLDPTLETGIAYDEGILHIVNKDIAIMLITK